MVGIGRSVSEFRQEADVLRTRWRSLHSLSGDTDHESSASTALWEYYKPILQALDSMGGEATLQDIEQRAEPQISSLLKPGDVRTMARGRPRWKMMIRRARKHLVHEGFIEDATGKVWRITPAGRRAAGGEIRRQDG